MIPALILGLLVGAFEAFPAPVPPPATPLNAAEAGSTKLDDIHVGHSLLETASVDVEALEKLEENPEETQDSEETQESDDNPLLETESEDDSEVDPEEEEQQKLTGHSFLENGSVEYLRDSEGEPETIEKEKRNKRNGTTNTTRKGTTIASVFEDFDENNDGYLDHADLDNAGFEDVWKTFDADNDGRLSKDEFSAFMADNKLFGDLDKNHDGFLNDRELKISGIDDERRWEKFDADKDKKLSKDEFETFLVEDSSLLDEWDEAPLESLEEMPEFEDVDTNGDELLDGTELKAAGLEGLLGDPENRKYFDTDDNGLLSTKEWEYFVDAAEEEEVNEVKAKAPMRKQNRSQEGKAAKEEEIASLLDEAEDEEDDEDEEDEEDGEKGTVVDGGAWIPQQGGEGSEKWY